MWNKSKIKGLIIGLMLTLAWFQISNVVLFSHTHYLNGKYIVHAHPFSSTSDQQPIKQHHHSNLELFFIAIGSNATCNNTTIEIPDIQPLFPILFNFTETLLANGNRQYSCNRAPPFQ
ncbi:MAG: hypothetical protein H6536_05830 [Bacteroidales bacterium]|nr:hypothetical protein [Bacteroidales bacterium]